MSRNSNKKPLHHWLEEVDYRWLNSARYTPSQESLKFMNFIKLVNGYKKEGNKTPPMHLRMIDRLVEDKNYVANLCFRGSGKTTLFMEYFVLYLAMFGEWPGLGDVSGVMYISDSMENGAKSARKNIEYRYYNSEFLQEWIPGTKFTDGMIEFTNKAGHKLGVRLYGAMALSLDTVLYKAEGGGTTIGKCEVGERIIGADGNPTTITHKSDIFHKPMYRITLQDGRSVKVSEDHLNQVWVKDFKKHKTPYLHTYSERTLTTFELLKEPLVFTCSRGIKRPRLWVEFNKPVQWPHNEDALIDPYTVGLLLGDGSMHCKGTGTTPVVLTALETDWQEYVQHIPYELGKIYVDPRSPITHARTIKGIDKFVRMMGLNTTSKHKRVPKEYLYGSVEQRLALLQGLMDTDGTIGKDNKRSYTSASKGLVEDVMFLVRSLGGYSYWQDKGNERAYACSVYTDLPLFRLKRKLDRQKPMRNKGMMAIVAIDPIPDEPSQCIAVSNEDRQFVCNDFIRTHNSGLRGSKIYGKRPTIAILDDLISDETAKSKASMALIRDTIYKGVNHALDPTRRKVIFNGTPFNKDDVLVEAVESGGWNINVWPVCEKFPCSREEFAGAWEDRFSYDYIKDQYELAIATGKTDAFYQELMLRLSHDDDRLVQESEIGWYSRQALLSQRERYNFYITTDFATSSKQTADYTVISVWAYGGDNNWYWIDGICKRQAMDRTLDNLFSLVQDYEPQQVGIEITGQQGGFIPWIQKEMSQRDIWFNFASNSPNKTSPGIRPVKDKLSRFNRVVPLFKQGKVKFPQEMKDSIIVGEFLQELRLVTHSGIKGKDDCLDTISMLSDLSPWNPLGSGSVVQESIKRIEHDPWDSHSHTPSDTTSFRSYII